MTTRTRKLTRTAKLRSYLASGAGQKITHMLPAVAVFGVAAYQSYWHTVEVAKTADPNGTHSETAYMLPISIDGLMIVAARYVTHAKTRLGKAISFLFFTLGVSATLGSNILAAEPNLIARIVAVWPAVALVGAAAVLHWGERAPKPAARPARVRKPKTEVQPESKGLHSVA